MGSWFAEHIVEIVIASATAYGSLIAFFVALYKWYRNEKFKEMNTLYQLYDKTRNDNDIAEAISIVDWIGSKHTLEYDNGNFIVDHGKIDGDKFERNIDAALALLSHICYLRKNSFLSDEDMKNFDYRIRRIVDCPVICDYLYSLYHFAAAQGTTMSFIHLVDYLIEKNWLDKDFKCPKQNRCVYQLNDGAMYQEYLAKHSCEHCK